MFRTAVFKLRVTRRKAQDLDRILARWGQGFRQALGNAQRDPALMRAIRMHTGKSGHRSLVADAYTIKRLAYNYCKDVDLPLHSSCRAGLAVAVEELLKSYVGLRREWIKGGKTAPAPGWPSLLPNTDAAARQEWQAALAESEHVTTLPQEDAWRARVTRAAKGRVIPIYFGAMQAGVNKGVIAHGGMIQRRDGKLFALLSTWGRKDRRARPIQRARNRADRGDLRNLVAEQPFVPTRLQRCAMMFPLEFGRGHRTNFTRRAVPRSAEVVKKGSEFFLHVAFRFVEPKPRPLSGNVLAVQRDVDQFARWVVLSPDRKILAHGTVSWREIAKLVDAKLKVRQQRSEHLQTHIRRVHADRRRQQQQGKILAGDRRISRVAEHHLYSAGRFLRHLACQYQAEVVLLGKSPSQKSPRGNAKTTGKRRGSGGSAPLLALRHFAQLQEILAQLLPEAGLPAPLDRPIYASHRTCPTCGWAPGDHVRIVEAESNQCAGCGRQHQQTHLAHLLALDTLRLRAKDAGQWGKNPMPKLGEWIRGMI